MTTSVLGNTSDRVYSSWKNTPYPEIPHPEVMYPLSEYLSHKPNNKVMLLLVPESDPAVEALTIATAERLSANVKNRGEHTVTMYDYYPSYFPAHLRILRLQVRTIFYSDLAFVVRGEYVRVLRAPRSRTGYVDIEA